MCLIEDDKEEGAEREGTKKGCSQDVEMKFEAAAWWGEGDSSTEGKKFMSTILGAGLCTLREPKLAKSNCQ